MVKNKIILINPALHFQKPLNHGMYPNTAIMVLATILNNAGFKVKIINGRYQKINDCLASILSELDESLLFVGFSIMTVQLPWAYYVSKAMKSKAPQVPIIWGGVHPTLFPEQTVEDPAVDIVVVDEAASTIVDLAKTLSQKESLSAIPGILYKDSSNLTRTPVNQEKDNFNNIPFINFDLINHEKYSKNNNIAIEDFYADQYRQKKVYPIIAGLGCSYRCTFCINVILGKKYTYREAPEIIERIKFLQKDYGADFIHTMDENFFISKKRTFEFLDLLEKENINIKWRPQIRPDYFNDNYINLEVAKRLERSGMVVAAMGVESASQWMLDKLQKNMQVEQIIKTAEILSKTNIVPKMNFMVGLPGESEEDIQKTFALAVKIRKMVKKSCVSVTPFKPYPGSQLYDEIVSNYGYQPPQSLKDWAHLSEKEFSESAGYESFRKYKWIKNPKRLLRTEYVYNQMAWHKTSFYGKMRSKISMLRFDLNFFSLVSLEEALFKLLSKIKGLIKELKYVLATHQKTV